MQILIRKYLPKSFHTTCHGNTCIRHHTSIGIKSSIACHMSRTTRNRTMNCTTKASWIYIWIKLKQVRETLKIIAQFQKLPVIGVQTSGIIQPLESTPPGQFCSAIPHAAGHTTGHAFPSVPIVPIGKPFFGKNLRNISFSKIITCHWHTSVRHRTSSCLH